MNRARKKLTWEGDHYNFYCRKKERTDIEIFAIADILKQTFSSQDRRLC